LTKILQSACNPLQTKGGLAAAYYLRNFLGYKDSEHKINFLELLRRAIYRNSNLYSTARIPKRNGKYRILNIPCHELKIVQRLINKTILQKTRVLKCTFGFYGGSGLEALKKVVKPEQAIFSVDIVDAFSNTTARAVYHVFRRLKFGHFASYYLTCLTTWLHPTRSFSQTKRQSDHDFAHDRSDELHAFLSFGGFNFAGKEAKLQQNSFVLPQGAPTSPRLFDLCFWQLDYNLVVRAIHVKGYYVRFADNLYFSAPEFWRDGQIDITKNNKGALLFHSPLISSIYDIMRAGYRIWIEPFQNMPRYTQKWYQIYKLHKARLLMPDDKDCLPALGYNVFPDGTIRNKRRFVLRIRMSVFNLRKALESGNYEDTWRIYQKLQGQMQFAIHDQLPPRLLKQATDLLSQINSQQAI
jgi:hypothetical protein